VCDLSVCDFSVWDLRVCDIGVLLARLGLAEPVGCEREEYERVRGGAQGLRPQHAGGRSAQCRFKRLMATFAGGRIGKHRNPFV
jgi:hypothetical protein